VIDLSKLFTQFPWMAKVLQIVLFFLLAGLVSRLSERMARGLAKLSRKSQHPSHKSVAERQKTLQSLIASAVSFGAFTLAAIISLSLFVDSATLIWIVGLFSAAFGLSARPVISDVLVGISFLFEDTFAVGEKVEILGMEGVIEAINLRTTWMRSPTGELYTIPNGEIRVVRNFSRGKFSMINIAIKIGSENLSETLQLLAALGQEAVLALPNLLEPWQIISESGTIGQHAELTILAKARFGKAAEMRPRLLAYIHEHLNAEGIQLTQ
jgi:small-conductance mechanosensitive channel